MFGIRLPYWVYYVVSFLFLIVAVLAALIMEGDKSQRSKALQVGPPSIVDIQDFDKEKHEGPAREVFVRAQVDMSMNRQLTRWKEDEVKDRADMVPLYAPDATSTEAPPRAVLFEKIKGLDNNPFVFNKLLERTTVGEGPIGPIIEVNGLLETGRTAKSMVSNAFRDEGRAYNSRALLIDPFIKSRQAELQPRFETHKVLTVILGASLLLAIIGYIKKKRRDARMQAAKIPTVKKRERSPF